MKVPLCIVVLLCIKVPLPVGVAVLLTLAAVGEVVELMCLYLPPWEHRLSANALVTVIATVSKILQNQMIPNAKRESGHHFVRQQCNSQFRTY